MKWKKLLFFLFLFFFVFSCKDAKALSITLYDSNYKNVGSCTNCTSVTPDNGIDYVVAVRVSYPETPLVEGMKYRLETTYNIFTKSAPGWQTPHFYMSGSMQNVSQVYYQINGTESTPMIDGTTGTRYNVGYIGDFTASKSGSGFIEFPFSSRVALAYFQVTSNSFTYSGNSTTDSINSNSQLIINNNNNNTNKIIEKQKENTQAIKDLTEEEKKNTQVQKETNDTIKDSDTSGAESNANSFFEDFKSDDYGLSDVITMPLTFIKGLANNSCNSLNLPLPFVEQNAVLPCMNSIYEKHFNSFLKIYQIITTGFISYWVCINIFALVQGFKNPDNDKVEVMNL